jgi:hypothetical protein
MEKLRPDKHQTPISRLGPRPEGGVQATLTVTWMIAVIIAAKTDPDEQRQLLSAA